MAIISQDYCGACQYWNGQRKVAAFKDKAEVKSTNDKGTCMNGKNFAVKGKSVRCNQYFKCRYFEKWDQLK